MQHLYPLTLKNPSITFSLSLYENTTVTPWNYPAHYLKDWDRSKRLQVESWTDTYGSSLVFGEGSQFNSSVWREWERKPQSSYFKLEVANKKINFNLKATGFKTTRGTNETSPLAINWKLSKATKSSECKIHETTKVLFPKHLSETKQSLIVTKVNTVHCTSLSSYNFPHSQSASPSTNTFFIWPPMLHIPLHFQFESHHLGIHKLK